MRVDYSVNLFDKMEPNQAIFVMHLRTNPHNVEQVKGDLVTTSRQMCALGLGLEAFDMIKKYKETEKDYMSNTRYDPYKEIAAVLNMPEAHVHSVYSLNDDYDLTFSQIADVMEQYFSQNDLFHYATESPESLYRANKEIETAKKCKEFVKAWEATMVKHNKVVNSLAADLGVSAYDLRQALAEDWSGEDFFDEYIDDEEDF